MKQDTIILTSLASAALAGWLLLKILNKSMQIQLPDPNYSSRGYRNHNPLNIRYNSINTWKGKYIPNNDGEFEQFVSMAYGYRTAMFLIRKYIKEGLTTVSQIISKWAPAKENNTSGYISRVCDTTGWLPNQTINPNSAEQIQRLVYAMALVENKSKDPAPSMSEIQQGWNLL